MPKHIVIDARGRRTSTGRYVDRLMQHLQRLDTKNRYTILLEPGDDWQPSAKNFSAVTCPYKRFSFNVFNQITFGSFLRKLQPDLVHFAMTPQEPVFYRGNRVTTTHDLTMFRFVRAGRMNIVLHGVRMVGYRMLFWHATRVAKHIIVPTNFVAEDLAKHFPYTKDKITVTYEASEPPLTTKAEPLKGVAKPFIMHAGSPFPHKNIERLVEAFEELKTKHPDLQLVLVGKKEHYFEQLQKQIDASRFKASIIVPGFVSDAELKWLYTNAEAYILPALSEGFGLPGLEAMTHGCPVAASNATCLPEVYGDAAHFFDPTDVHDMVEKIDELLGNDKLKKDLIKKGAEQLKKYSWTRMAEQTLKLYKQILKDA